MQPSIASLGLVCHHSPGTHPVEASVTKETEQIEYSGSMSMARFALAHSTCEWSARSKIQFQDDARLPGALPTWMMMRGLASSPSVQRPSCLRESGHLRGGDAELGHRLGHATPSLVMNTYGHVTERMQRDATMAMNNVLRGASA